MVNVEELLKDTGALLKGHFLLSSGLHSDTYIQCAKLLQKTRYAKGIGSDLALKLQRFDPDCVVSPAIGGIVIGYEVARSLNISFMFAERDSNDVMTFRRGFDPANFKRVVIVEDVVTTGKSTQEVIEALKRRNSHAVATSSIISRTEMNEINGLPFLSLITLPLKSYTPEECPLCKNGVPLSKPGTRKIFN